MAKYGCVGDLSASKIDAFAHFMQPIVLHCNLCVCSIISLPFHSSSPVSHTTDDMIFQWDPTVALVVDEAIELPQLALVKNHTADCKFCEKKDEDILNLSKDTVRTLSL